ncbi:MAG: hypothetical protein E6G76_25990 [Alphaproteobacteria bacterium]|nr:MAG: hypothetical protein E6G76_25990 [Alphaproteobacteria bacterium]
MIAFERVEAAALTMLEAVKEALVYLDAPPGSALAGRARCVNYCSPHRTVLAPTNKCLAQINNLRTAGKATKKH